MQRCSHAYLRYTTGALPVCGPRITSDSIIKCHVITRYGAMPLSLASHEKAERGLSSAHTGVRFEGTLKRWSKPGTDSAKDRIGIKLLRGAVLTLTAAGEGC